jgi:uncharacterized membrane protein YphA (DoxX/SURF4 family)
VAGGSRVAGKRSKPSRVALAPARHRGTASALGGGLLIVGALTRVSALLNAGVLLGALLLVKLDIGLIAPMGAPMPGAELEFGLLAGLLAVALLGPGKPSVDHALGLEAGTPVVREEATI